MQFHDVTLLVLQWKTMCHTKHDNFKKQTNKNGPWWIYKLWSFNLLKGIVHAFFLKYLMKKLEYENWSIQLNSTAHLSYLKKFNLSVKNWKNPIDSMVLKGILCFSSKLF